MRRHLTEDIIRLNNDNLTRNIWGGHWILQWKGLKVRKAGPIGESWEFSGHPHHPSQVQVESGRYVSLATLLRRYPAEILGQRVRRRWGPNAPFLVKLIDAKQTLSLQVHPDDRYAKRHEADQGKYESWIIVGVAGGRNPGCIYLGFDGKRARQYKTPFQFRRAFLETMAKTNQLGPSLNPKIRRKAAAFVLPFVNKISVRPGDVYELPPGTIHAIGQGIRIFEIQTPSDVTYRIWDWNRPDTDVKKGSLRFRTLHLDKAADVLKFQMEHPRPVRRARLWGRACAGKPWVEESLIRNSKAGYAVNHIVMAKKHGVMSIKTKGEFFLLTVIQGQVKIGERHTIRSGQSVLVPACLPEATLTNLVRRTVLLKSFCL